jgi:hypothetical protein
MARTADPRKRDPETGVYLSQQKWWKDHQRIQFDKEDRKIIKRIQSAYKYRTIADAVRGALKLAERSLPPV